MCLPIKHCGVSNRIKDKITPPAEQSAGGGFCLSQKRTDICILAMIIEKTKLRNDREFKNEPEPPQMAPKGKMVFNLPYEKAQSVCCWQKDRGEAKSGQKVRNML